MSGERRVPWIFDEQGEVLCLGCQTPMRPLAGMLWVSVERVFDAKLTHAHGERVLRFHEPQGFIHPGVMCLQKYLDREREALGASDIRWRLE